MEFTCIYFMLEIFILENFAPGCKHPVTINARNLGGTA